MGGLILKLRPHEELLINGVLVENGARSARLRVKTEGAHILRLRDALRPEEVTTPIKQAYYHAQLAVAGQVSDRDTATALRKSLDAIIELDLDIDLIKCIANHDFYHIMRALRPFAIGDGAAKPTDRLVKCDEPDSHLSAN